MSLFSPLRRKGVLFFPLPQEGGSRGMAFASPRAGWYGNPAPPQGMAWLDVGVVDVDIAKLSTKASRVNITLPDRSLDTIDRHVKARGETRSGFLARAVIEALSRDAAWR
ncbi:MAG: ribbon-helix-helix protein, CopG family [Rhodanobacteraceae bacterium]|nr:MAG: ribbon-helix-helix protein, CopG family [Rhodanobacteraceae bacterium]